MKSLKDYLPEAERWIDNPVQGDSFGIELAPDHLIESYVVDTTDDGIIINGDDRMIELLESYGHTTETIRRYGPVGSNRGVGFTVAEGGQRADSLVTDALKIMRGAEVSDAVSALKTVLGDREYNQRRGHYNFYVRQMLDMYGQQGVTEGKDIDARISNLKDAIRSETPRSVPGEDHREQYARHAEKIAGYKAELKKLMAQKKQGVAEGEGLGYSRDPNQAKWYHQGRNAFKGGTTGSTIQDIAKKHGCPPEWLDVFRAGYQDQTNWSKKDTVEEDTMGRMLELAGISRTSVEETAPYQPEQNAAHTDPLAAKAVELAPIGALEENSAQSISFNNRMVDRASLEVDDVHSWDYPDFSDAYISYATYTDGTPLSDDELEQFNDQHSDLVHELAYDSLHEDTVDEAKYHGREVPLGKPMAGDVKKSKVYVRDPKTGNVIKVNFGHGGTSAKRAGQKPMHIKKDNPARRKSFRARHNCDNPGPRTKARYWSCRAW